MADRLAPAIQKSTRGVVPKTNHDPVLLGKHPMVASALRAFRRGW